MLCITNSIQAQNGSIFFEINYHTFSHNSLKEFQQELANDIPEVDMMANDEFPANFGIKTGYRIESINSTIFAGFASTGGKMSYSDYSGTIRLTQPLNGYTLGAMHHIYLDSRKNFSLALKMLTTYSTLKVVSYYAFEDEIYEDQIKLYAFDYGVGTELIYEYPLGFIKLRGALGYDFVLGGKLHLKDKNDY